MQCEAIDTKNGRGATAKGKPLPPRQGGLIGRRGRSGEVVGASVKGRKAAVGLSVWLCSLVRTVSGGDGGGVTD